jgi:hypothetical protein
MFSGRGIGPAVCLHIEDAGASLRTLGREFESAERRVDQQRNKMGRRRDGESDHILRISRAYGAITTSMTIQGYEEKMDFSYENKEQTSYFAVDKLTDE